MCEQIPSVTLWGTTQLTSTITTSTILTSSISQSTRLVTSQVITKAVFTSLVPQQTLFYPCSDLSSAQSPGPSAGAISSTQRGSQQPKASDANGGEGSIDPNATGQFTGSLPLNTRLSQTSSQLQSRSLSLISPSRTAAPSVPTPSASASGSTSPPVISSLAPSATAGEGTGENAQSQNRTSSQAGTIAGAVVGSICALILLIMIGLCIQRRRTRTNSGSRRNDWSEKSLPQSDVGNDYWERRFREIESANSSRGLSDGLGSGSASRLQHQPHTVGGVSDERKKGDWDSQTSRKLRLTLDLGSKDLESRPPSRLSMISSFFGGRITPTPNFMPSPHHRAGSHARSHAHSHSHSRKPSTARGSTFSFNPFKKIKYTPNHSRSISSPWVQEDSRSITSPNYSYSSKSPGPNSSFEENRLVINHTQKSRLNQNQNQNQSQNQIQNGKRLSQSTFGNKISAFNQPSSASREREEYQYDNESKLNINTDLSRSMDNSVLPTSKSTSTQDPPVTGNTFGGSSSNGIVAATTQSEGRVVESPTEEEIEERRNMEWIRHSTVLSDQGEGEETLDSTDEEQLKSKLGISEIDDLGGYPNTSVFSKALDNGLPSIAATKPFLGLGNGQGQYNPSIGNTPPQLGAIGNYTSLNSHLSSISTIQSLPPAGGGNGGTHLSGISTTTSSFIPFIPAPRGGHFSGISSIGSNSIPFVPMRGGHFSGLSTSPSTVLPRGYLSGLSSAHSFNNHNYNQKNTRPKSPDSMSIPSDIIIGSPTEKHLSHSHRRPGFSSLHRKESQSTVSTYSTHPVSPSSTHPSFGISRPTSETSEARTATYYRNSRRSLYPPSRSTSVKVKRTLSGQSSSVKDSIPPPLPFVQNRKSAFEDSEYDKSPPATSFLIPNNITRRSLKIQRESKGKHVPKIRLSQRALTPSLWIDEELLARFADAAETSESTMSDGVSTIKVNRRRSVSNPPPPPHAPSQVQDSSSGINEKMEANGSMVEVEKEDRAETTLISRFSGSTESTEKSVVSRKGSSASIVSHSRSSVISDDTSSRTLSGDSRSTSNTNTNSMFIPNTGEEAKPSDYDGLDMAMTTPLSTPTPTPIPRPAKLDKGKGRAITILSPHTPPNRLPLFSPPFPKPPTPPLPSWAETSTIAIPANLRWSIKERRKMIPTKAIEDKNALTPQPTSSTLK
ncbi:uncharacterized protein IL334_007655 [Kwoniella shivajii]|uniref:Uncharacterized protein n=1 Tax=Kwoniella shivajii TaxID=564305 RepID=A0ABZ1D992_9TREE|nr:hypothetical protein IL334_007655 [Kwoniella shivajii]